MHKKNLQMPETWKLLMHEISKSICCSSFTPFQLFPAELKTLPDFIVCTKYTQEIIND